MKSKILSYILSTAIAAAVAFGSGYNETIDALLLATVWLFIVIGGITASIVAGGILAIGWLEGEGEISQSLADNWKAIKKPNWWISIPLSVAWLSALVYVEWTVTAVAYFIETLILYTVSVIMFDTIHKLTGDDDDPVNSILNPSVKQAVLDSRKDK